MDMQDALDGILDELGRTLPLASDDRAKELVQVILDARAVFVAGAGRSGLAVRCFAMRLMHLGVHTHVVGEVTAPGITEEDLLLIGSGSGATASLVSAAEKARSIGAKIALITIQEDSPTGKRADIELTIPAPTPKIAEDTGFRSIQPMGSLFEQCLLLVLDALILLLMDKTGTGADAMFARHANLE